jgi:ABC-type uncharacterized transport system permease subunit
VDVKTVELSSLDENIKVNSHVWIAVLSCFLLVIATFSTIALWDRYDRALSRKVSTTFRGNRSRGLAAP